MRITLTLAACVASAVTVMGQGTFYVPNGLGNVEGNSSMSDPLSSASFRFQQVFASSQFAPNGVYRINSIWFRLDGATVNNPALFFGGGSVTLSTTTRGPDGLSTTFADNPGGDATTIFSGAISFGGLSQPGAMPQAFRQTFIATTPFYYNPAQGNLLLDVAGAGGQVFIPGSLDAHSAVGDSISRVFASSDLVGAGTADTLGLVTRFDVSPVPEPSTWMLAVLGLGAVFLFRRARRSVPR